MYNLVGFHIFTSLCNHTRYLFSEHFHHPKWKSSVPIEQSLPIPPPHQTLATMICFLSLWKSPIIYDLLSDWLLSHRIVYSGFIHGLPWWSSD